MPIVMVITEILVGIVFIVSDFLIVWLKWLLLLGICILQIIIVCIQAAIIKQQHKQLKQKKRLTSVKQYPIPNSDFNPEERKKEWEYLLKFVEDFDEEAEANESTFHEKSVITLPKGVKLKNHQPLPEGVEVLSVPSED